jgi:hypothetical protein
MSLWPTELNFSWSRGADPKFKNDKALVELCVKYTAILRKYFSNLQTSIEVCPLEKGTIWEVAFVVYNYHKPNTSIREIIDLFPATVNEKKVVDVNFSSDGKIFVTIEMVATNSKSVAQVYAENESRHRRSQSKHTRRSPSPDDRHHRRSESKRRAESTSRRHSPSRRRSLSRSHSPGERSRSPNRRAHSSSESHSRSPSVDRQPGVLNRVLKFALGH